MFYQIKKKQFSFIDDVHEINNQSCCILSGPPCIYYIRLKVQASEKCQRSDVAKSMIENIV